MTDLRSLLRAGQYAMIAADPPWRFKSFYPPSADHRYRRDVERYYPTMTLDGIKAFPVREVAAPGCHLFLWTTGPHIPEALEVIKAWGFKYSGIGFTWVKLRRSIDTRQLRLVATMEQDLHVGLGFTTRKNAEFCLLARRGAVRRVSRIILAPVREHSRKPDEFYQRAMEYADGPYLDLFARERRPGWDAWGHEVDKFTEAA